jgi:hypothetical protein
MISINFMGGLGNQLFQVSATYSLAKSNNDDCVFDFNKCYTPLQGNQIIKYRNTIFKNFTHFDSFIAENHYQETSYYYNQIQYKPNLLLNGYFQSEKYFEKHKESLIDMFYFDDYKDKALSFLSNIKGTKTSLHIRRGDYIPYQSVMYLLDEEYYTPATNYFKDTTFIIFSDDLNLAKQKFNKPNMVVFDSNDEVLNMTCMSLCDNNIIANSTFSWWGAYLNKNKNKTVIAPKKWYSAPELKENKDKIPEQWIVL